MTEKSNYILPLDSETESLTKKGSRTPKGKHPLEIEYWHILPALRRELAMSLKEKGLKQREIANILGITEAAVSQYVKGCRGKLIIKEDSFEQKIIEFPTWLDKEIKKSTETIIVNRTESFFIKETNRLMYIIRSRPKDFLCTIHEAFGEKVENCTICFPYV